MPTKTIRDSARVVATELVREPVKEAVREALHEETAEIRPASGGTGASSERAGDQRSSTGTEGSEQGGRSKLAVIGVLLAIGGVAYLARRRMSSAGGSAWSEPSPGAVAADDAEGGYVSEGEMQTTETADESESDAEGTGTSTSTATDQ